MKLSADHTKYLVGFANCIQTLPRDFQITGYGNCKVPFFSNTLQFPFLPILLQVITGVVIMANMHHVHFSGLNCSNHLVDQLLRLSRSFCNISTSSLHAILVQIFVSSANILICVVIQLGRSLTKITGTVAVQVQSPEECRSIPETSGNIHR